MVCCCDAIGNLSRLIVIALTAGGIFQVFAAMDCEFIKYEAGPALPAGLSRTIGLFVDDDMNSNECLKAITDSEDVLGSDPFFKTARSMIILSLIGAFCAGCLVLFEFLCCRICCAVLLENLTFLASIVCGALVFLAYYNPFCDTADEVFQDVLDTKDVTLEANEAFECTFGQGGIFNVVAICFYAAAATVLCCSPKPTPLISQMSK